VIINNTLVKPAGASTPAESPAAPQESRCGAMSQQPCHGDTTSVPQTFLHLVGCREPKAELKAELKAEPKAKPPAAPVGRSRAR
jgi:hypothetical protein